ncbi:fatty acid desaturase [Pyxidicoccus parkwayensis]|uniref:Fatty acid desaturase n=1 Tax=Pyxidicoccus parkwayensis TaxID=2813578 RepID=A0ABX7NX66_9BACT|nr:fatty acid desaturase [Pyxidicoccus parkwaysis]QSQ21994.1 fatty acid desaturase [Pyxidicoccus parkwaysis]
MSTSASLQAASTAPEPLPRRAAVPHELLVQATVPGLLRLAALDWVWMGACWLAMARWPWVTPLAVLVIAGRIHALGVIFHDAVHLRVRRKSVGLRFVEVLAGYPVASTWESTRYHHLRHHHDAGLPTDPYRRRPLHGWRMARAWLLLVGVVPFWVLRGPVGLLAWAVPALRVPYARLFLQARASIEGAESKEGRAHATPDGARPLIHAPASAGLKESDEVRACACSELGQVLFHLCVLALAWRWPHAVVWGYALPLLVASGFNAHRLLAEHTPAQAHGRTLADVLAVTADHGLGWLGRLWLAPRNVGCHVVHHLHPQVSLEHLPRLRAWYVARFPSHYPSPRRF